MTKEEEAFDPQTTRCITTRIGANGSRPVIECSISGTKAENDLIESATNDLQSGDEELVLLADSEEEAKQLVTTDPSHVVASTSTSILPTVVQKSHAETESFTVTAPLCKSASSSTSVRKRSAVSQSTKVHIKTATSSNSLDLDSLLGNITTLHASSTTGTTRRSTDQSEYETRLPRVQTERTRTLLPSMSENSPTSIPGLGGFLSADCREEPIKDRLFSSDSCEKFHNGLHQVGGNGQDLMLSSKDSHNLEVTCQSLPPGSTAAFLAQLLPHQSAPLNQAATAKELTFISHPTTSISNNNDFTHDSPVSKRALLAEQLMAAPLPSANPQRMHRHSLPNQLLPRLPPGHMDILPPGHIEMAPEDYSYYGDFDGSEGDFQPFPYDAGTASLDCAGYEQYGDYSYAYNGALQTARHMHQYGDYNEHGEFSKYGDFAEEGQGTAAYAQQFSQLDDQMTTGVYDLAQLESIFHMLLNEPTSVVHRDAKKMKKVREVIDLIKNLQALTGLPGTTTQNEDVIMPILQFAKQLVEGSQ